ncbi:MAG: hypothetical protein RLZZ426_397 [Actinomycetota bacterium]|jgi:hypothetical protein
MTTLPSSSFGRADADGTVYVKTAQSEVAVGQYTIGTPEEGLAFYATKFDQLLAEANLTVTRLKTGRGTVESAREVAAKLLAQVESPSMVGDHTVFIALAIDLQALAEIKQVERAAAKAAAREAALVRRVAIADEAEKLANSTSWKTTQEKFTALLEEWKTLSRGERDSEQVQWKRFSAARQTFDRARRNHFAELTKTTAAAKTAKSAILAEALELSTSTEWGPATLKFRDLMDRWKAAPRGSKKDDDALWAKFRAAQQVFFDAKKIANSARDEEFKANLAVKLELLKEAEAILPIKDIAAAKKALRSVSDRWATAGHVPRNDMERVEARLRAVEEAIREAEQEEWRRSDPSRKAFAASTASRFQEAADRLEAEVAAARAKNSPKLAKLEEQLVNAKALVEAAAKHA